MPSQLIEITAEYLGERFRFENPDGDVVVADAHANGTINAPITIKGPADVDELRRRHSYRFYGKWSKYTNRRTGESEEQFCFQTFVAVQPHNRDGVIAYLRHAGQGFGFGAARAAALWDAFGSEAVQVFREEPERVVNYLAGRGLPITTLTADRMVDRLVDQQATEACMIDLTELLARRGFRKTLARWLIQDKGNRASEIVRRDAYKLLPYPGCGFDSCDQMYLSLGGNPSRLKRQALAAWDVIDRNRNGDTWMPRSVAEAGIKARVGGADLRIEKAIELAIRSGMLREIRTDGMAGPITPDGSYRWLASRAKADKEARLAELIADAMQDSFEWPAISEVANINGEQPEVLSLALRGAIAILGGRPGAGKTFVGGNLIAALLRHFGEGSVGIGAPTNLAAKRLTESMAKAGVGIRARTWHSLLGRPMVRGKEWYFDEDTPFPFNVIVGDEESMKDVDIMTAMFAARAKGTMVLLIGDVNQLPPVSHGAPLRDMIAAGLPYGELREIRRNSGGIVEACSAIVDGKPWGAGDNLEIIEVNEEDDQLQAILGQMHEARKAGLDPIWDCRIIVARNETRRSINTALQAVLNTNPGVPGSPFRVGDKIICGENEEYRVIGSATNADGEPVEDGKQIRVANGDLARVLSVADDAFIAQLIYPEAVIRIPRGKVSDESKTGTGCAWELAYAVTYHKSQGSQFPWAILVASTRDGRMGSRELVYTGISRAEQKCKLIGRKEVFDRFCRRVALGQRKTLLKELILLNVAKLELATI